MKKVKLIALLSAALAAVLLFFFLNSLQGEEVIAQREVITASVDIPSNTTITESMLTVSELPEVAVLQNAINNRELAVGKTASSDILAGEQVLGDKLYTPGEESGGTLAYTIEPDMRAITISVGVTSGLSGMLKPRDKVDIIAQFEVEENDKVISYMTMLAQNLTILAVDATLNKVGKEIDDENPGESYCTITLQATPRQAMELSFGEYEGQLRAVLRSPLDDKKINLPNLTIKQILFE